MLHTVDLESVEKLQKLFVKQGLNFVEIVGSLLDNYIFDGEGKFYSFVIKEKYLNEWSSCMTIRRYKRLPKKYKKIMEHIQNEENEQGEKLFFS